MSSINLANVANPPTPPTGTTEVFVASDKKLKQIDDAGVVTDLTAAGSGEANTASNVGGAEGIFKQKTGVDLEFKTIVAGTNITLTPAADTLTISGPPSSGEANTASNVGAGSGVFKTKVGVDLQFKTLVAGANVTITPGTDEVTIASADADTGITQLTNDVTAGPGSGSQAATIAANAVTNSKLNDMPTARFKARATAGTGDPEDITGTQATTLIDSFTSGLKGLAPASGGGTINFLRADGTWNEPPSGSSFDPTTQAQGFDDFLSAAIADETGAFGWAITNNGTGTTPAMIPGEINHPGIIRLPSGTTGTARSAIHLGITGALSTRSIGGLIYTTSVRVSATLLFSRFSAGLGDTFAAFGDQTNGVYFTFDPAAAETTWHLVAANGGTRTRRDTGIPVVAGTWYCLKFTIDAGASSIQANVDGVNVGAAITTNIPATSLAFLYKSEGIGAGVIANADIDYWHYTQTGLTR